MIYRDTRLIWAARLNLGPPVALNVCRFGTTPGLITALDETGQLSVLYLGTDPPTNSVGGFETKELNYESMDAEHQSLLKVIRESQSDSRTEPKDKVIIRAQVPLTVDISERERCSSRYEEDTTSFAVSDDGSTIETTVQIFVSYTGMNSIKNISINLEIPDAYFVVPFPSLLLFFHSPSYSLPLSYFILPLPCFFLLL